jgi:hypothetical protein
MSLRKRVGVFLIFYKVSSYLIINKNMPKKIHHKNNLQNIISDIKVLFMVYDKSGEIIDSHEEVFYQYNKVDKRDPNYQYNLDNYTVKAGLAKYGHIKLSSQKNISTVKARVLDFKIVEE